MTPGRTLNRGSILHGCFDLEANEAIQSHWESVIGSIPCRPLHPALEPFEELLIFESPHQKGEKWKLSGDNWEFFLPDSSTESLIAFAEYVACGEVLRRGGPKFLPVHAALVAPSAKGIIAVVGATTAGKSTTSVALWEAGWDLYCDDRCFIFESGGKSPEVIPIPRRISLRAPALELLKETTKAAIQDSPFSAMTVSEATPDNSRYSFRPSAIREGARNPSLQLRAVVILDPAAESKLAERMHPARAIRPLLTCTAIHPNQKPLETMIPWLSITEQVPVFQMGRASLSEMTDGFFQLASELDLIT